MQAIRHVNAPVVLGAAALLEHADRAMYQAKAQGRNCYSLVTAPYGLSPDTG